MKYFFFKINIYPQVMEYKTVKNASRTIWKVWIALITWEPSSSSQSLDAWLPAPQVRIQPWELLTSSKTQIRKSWLKHLPPRQRAEREGRMKWIKIRSSYKWFATNFRNILPLLWVTWAPPHTTGNKLKK